MSRLIAASCGLGALLGVVVGDPGEAASQANCPWDNRDFLGPCGPAQGLPPWGNGAWSSPEYYTTIQTGDIDGDGAAELLGRSAFGIEVHKFSKELGEWLPFLATVPDLDHRPVQDQYLLSQFADARGWNQPRYYATIQTGDIDGDGRAELLGRAPIGMIVFDYSPGAGGSRGEWRQLTGLLPGAQCVDSIGNVCATPFPDASGLDQPQYYSTIQLADVDGEPGAELHIRAGNGIWTYSWTGNAWKLIARITSNFTDDGSWDQPQFYSTIQFADIHGRPGAELVARGGGGITVWKLQGGQWSSLTLGGPFSGEGFAHPQYYLTIQTADVTGDGPAELLGKTANGIDAYQWQEDRWDPIASIYDDFCDSPCGWNLPQFYSTIQFADIDGDRAAELVARGNGALRVRKWAATGWDEIRSAESLALVEAYAATAFGRNVTVPLWNQPHYYATIQTADVDGDGAAELLARGSFGIRTWRLDTADPANPRWSRYRRYGYPDPAFATPGQLSAYKALNDLLGVPDVRQEYGGATISPDLSTYQHSIENTCADRTSTIPPQYASCTPPSGSGVGVADWTVVANKIVAELFHAQRVVGYYGQLATAQASVFANTSEELEAVAKQLKLDEQATSQNGEARFFTLVGNIAKALGGLASIAGQPEAAAALSTFSSIMGGISGTLPTYSNLVFEQTYNQAIQHILANEEQQRDAVGAQLSFVRGDLGLLTAVGELVSKPSPTLPVWQIDQDAYTSAARQAFATWVYQTFLPTIWDRWVITNCIEIPRELICSPPPNGDYMASYAPHGRAFTGLLPKQVPCGQIEEADCAWKAPSQDIVTMLWGPISQHCTFDRQAGTKWEYGSCTLGIATGPASDIFNNRNGWNFAT